MVCSARKEDELRETLALIEKASGRSSIFTADVVEHAQMLALFDHPVATYGDVDIVLANAGTVGESRKLHKSDPAPWRETIELNLIGAYNTVHAAVPHLRERGAGKIIVTGSGARYRAAPGLSAYGSSKIALWMMTQVLAVELQEFNISVNELIPGPVKTTMTGFGEQRFPPEEWVKEPEDVVPLALFLATQPDCGPTAQSYSLMRRA